MTVIQNQCPQAPGEKRRMFAAGEARPMRLALAVTLALILAADAGPRTLTLAPTLAAGEVCEHRGLVSSGLGLSPSQARTPCQPLWHTAW